MFQAERLTVFEFTYPENKKPKPHSLIVIGGLSDGFLTVPFLETLAEALENTEWSLFQPLLSSSYTGFGLSRLGRDVEEIGQCVEYVRNYKQAQLGDGTTSKVVIMGHSTGSQDTLHYLYMPNPLPVDPVFDNGLQHLVRPAVDGAILQAPVSDREAIQDIVQRGTDNVTSTELEGIFSQLVSMAKQLTYSEGLDVILPLNLTSKLGLSDAPISARRFLSLTSPDSPEHPQEDDLFSSDLTDQRLEETFGVIAERNLLKTKLLVLYSGKDQFVPEWVDKEKLLQRWTAATNKSGRSVWEDRFSGVVPGASHGLGNPDEDAARRDLAARVTGYLQEVVQPS